MAASINMDRRPEWGGFNMTLLALQVAPDAWWSAYLLALHRDRISATVQTGSDRRHTDGFMTQE
jgi:hypothetical protein